MLHADVIEAALRQQLPADLHAAIPALAQILADASTGAVGLAETQARLASSPGLADVLRALNGHRVEAGRSVISFNGAQTGDITISGDVAGRDVIEVNLGVHQSINVSGQATVSKIVGEEKNYYQTFTTPSQWTREQRDRRAMLARLKAIWIDGFLNKSLKNELRIELNLVYRPDVLDLALNDLYREWERDPEPLPDRTSIAEAFDRAGGELLILGAPGAGKTTLLLELLSDLLQRAEKDEAHPIPVVFPLSTWAAERKPIKDWLIDQLNVLYNVPEKIGRGWVTKNEVLPLLDGLDEVVATHRDTCLEALNEYQQKLEGLASIVVASRIADYETLQGRLRLRGAVLVSPLDVRQVENYLERMGGHLQAARGFVAGNLGVMELLDNPLMLNVYTLAFQSLSSEMLTDGNIDERKKHLWISYVKQMFGRKKEKTKFNDKQTVGWLASLARQMNNQKQAVFFVEYLNYRWITNSSKVWYFRLMVFVIWLIGLSTCRVMEVFPGYPNSLLFIVSFILVFITAVSVFGEPSSDMLTWSWSKAYSRLTKPLYKMLGPWLVFLLGFVAFFWLTGVLGQIQYAPYGMFFQVGLIILTVFVLMSGLFGGFIDATDRGATQNQILHHRPQGVLTLIVSGVPFNMTITFLLFLIGMCVNNIFTGYQEGFYLIYVALFGAVIVSIIAIAARHYTLRYLLYRQGSLPFRELIPWLDHCVDRLILHRVGGGYIFIHRLLMEHFAAMTDEDIARLSAEIEGARKKS